MTHARPCRLAILASHPIQYLTPIYRRLAAIPGLDVEVLFCRDFGVRSRYDKEFARPVQWDTDQLSGYRHRFLLNVSPTADTFTPLHAVNPGAFWHLLRGFDALWVNGYMYPSNWLAAGAALLRRTRILFRSELRLVPDRPPRRIDPLRERVIRAWVKRADALLYIGDANREAYRAYGAAEHQLFFCPYCVDGERIEAASRALAGSRAELRGRWGIPTGRVVVLYAGKLTPRKHPEAMLQLGDTDERTDGAHIVFTGSGPLGPALRAEVERRGLRNVTFLGFINQSTLPEVYAMADIFVMPSEDEPWGLVVNEAMAAGLPSVVSDRVGAIRDLTVHGETGFVFRSGDWKAMADIVERLRSDPVRRQKIGEAARARSRVYSYDAATAGIVDALSALGLYGRVADDWPGAALGHVGPAGGAR